MAGPIHNKVAASAMAGAVTTLIVGVLARRGVPFSADDAAALTTLLSGLAGYFIPGINPNGGNGG